MQRLQGLLGIGILLLGATAFSTNRRAIRLRVVLWGLALQLAFATLILKTTLGLSVFRCAKDVVQGVMGFANEGGRFVFGDAMLNLAPFTFVIHVPATIIFFSALMAVLYHLGIMQKIVLAMAKVMKCSMGVSGAESLSAAANVFVGMTEAPLVIRPYVEGMTHSELMAVMSGGFATIAGGVLMAYVGFGVDAGHLLSASVMSAPAALVMAKLLVPETGESETAGDVKIEFERRTVNVVDAAATGASDGMTLAINVVAMVLAFVGLVAMIDGGLRLLDGWLDPKLDAWFGFTIVPASLNSLFGFVFRPLAFCLGVEWGDCAHVGALLGKKIALNEFLAYFDLKALVASRAISPRSITIATYALCGFANFGSAAIQIGGIGALVPSRRQDLAKLGLRALAGGAMASFMTACVAGLLI